MKDIDLTELLPAAVFRCAGGQTLNQFPVFLTLPANLPKLPWYYRCTEELICTLVETVVSAARAERPVRMAVHQKQRLEDVETLLSFRPSGWIELQLDVKSPDETATKVRDLPERFGFRREEDWVPEDSSSRLVSYSCGDTALPTLVVWSDNHRANHRTSFLIPLPDGES